MFGLPLKPDLRPSHYPQRQERQRQEHDWVFFVAVDDCGNEQPPQPDGEGGEADDDDWVVDLFNQIFEQGGEWQNQQY